MARVLLADDEEALRLLMGRQLRRGGHEVTVVEDGLAAVAALEADTFDVVVSDMKMPRLDGMGLLEHAKRIAPDTEFVILTGHGNLENATQAFKAGNVFDYLLKPLEDIRGLDAVVTRAAERHQLRADNRRLVAELHARVAELEEAKTRLAHLAERDGLTGLFNYRTVHARLAAAVKAVAEGDGVLSVMLMDVDGFKLFNDTYGHPAGDQVLRRIADALRGTCGAEALVGRCGGDEFMVVLPGVTAAGAGVLADGVRAFVAAHPFQSPDGTAIPLPLCFGIADAAGVGPSAVSLVAAADAALYESKDRGGDAVTLHLTTHGDGANAGDRARTTFDVLDGLVRTIDNKDHYTKKHSEDVAEHALQLVQALGMSEDTCHAVRVAGLLHDVGKIGIPDSILRKPGRLTADEYEVIKGHVTLSALIIHGLPRMTDILEAVTSHHERWDGQGYPHGLGGKDIPLLGRIMGIADAYSAMTLTRPYRVGMTPDQALTEIERGAGTQFDPDLAWLFVETARRRAAGLPASLDHAA